MSRPHLVDHFLRARSSYNRIAYEVSARIADRGVTPLEWAALVAIEDVTEAGEKAGNSRLVKELGVFPSEATALSNSLIRKGMVRKVRDRGDKRYRPLKLTNEGLAFLRVMENVVSLDEGHFDDAVEARS